MSVRDVRFHLHVNQVVQNCNGNTFCCIFRSHDVHKELHDMIRDVVCVDVGGVDIFEVDKR